MATRTGAGDGFERVSSVAYRGPDGPATSRTIGTRRVALRPLTGISRWPAGESHPLGLRSTTSRTTTPGSPAVKTIRDVPAPEVIVPLTIVHVHVGPSPPETWATTPDTPLSRLAGAAMTGRAGRAFTRTRAEPEPWQPLATRR